MDEEKQLSTDQRVKSILAGLLDKDVLELKPGNSFIDDLDADSLATIEIVMHLEAEFDIKIVDAEAEKILTVGDAVELVKKLISEKPQIREAQLT